MTFFERKLLKKICFSLFAGVVFAGTCFAAENTKLKEKVSSKYYDELIKDGYVSRYRDNGSMDLLLLPESIYSKKIKDNMIQKDPKNYPYTFEGLYLLNKKDLLSKGTSKKSAITLDDVSVVVRSVSKMQGMKYYRKRPRHNLSRRTDGGVGYRNEYSSDGTVKRSRKR